MANYYKEQLKAYNDIDRILKRVILEKSSVKIDKIIYELTLDYEISNGNLKNRIKLYVENNDFLEIVDNEVVYKEVEE